MYWILFVFPVLFTLFINKSRETNIGIWTLYGILLIITIGFRNEVGCDWWSYLSHFQRTEGISLSRAFEQVKDPAHTFANWWMGQWGWGVYGVNFIYAVIFSIGLIIFSRTQMYPWLAMSVAVPYMVVMVSMGYSRQGVALGLFMLAITYIEKEKFKSYVFWVLMATLFHKTAIILLPFGLFLTKGSWWLRVAILLPVMYGGWDLLLAEKQTQLWENYVEKNMHSSGAYIRVFMNLLPAILLLAYRKKWKNNFADYPFWFWIAIGSIASMFLVGMATTAVDRISLYFIPLQLAVFSRLPFLAKNILPLNVTKLLIIIGYSLVLLVWLLFASHSHCWIPYKNILFDGLW